MEQLRSPEGKRIVPRTLLVPSLTFGFFWTRRLPGAEVLALSRQRENPVRGQQAEGGWACSRDDTHRGKLTGSAAAKAPRGGN